VDGPGDRVAVQRPPAWRVKDQQNLVDTNITLVVWQKEVDENGVPGKYLQLPDHRCSLTVTPADARAGRFPVNFPGTLPNISVWRENPVGAG
jgi:hypothetical protein